MAMICKCSVWRALMQLAVVALMLSDVRGGPALLQEGASFVVLTNSIVKITIQKPQGFITSFEYGTSGNLLNNAQNTIKSTASYFDLNWSQPDVEADSYVQYEGNQYRRVNRADDTTRVEVSFSRDYDGNSSSVPLYVDTRFVLLQDSPGVYVYHIITHNATFPDFDLQQMRTVWRLNPAFDYAVVTDTRQRVMPSQLDISNARSEATLIAESRKLLTPSDPDFTGEIHDKYHYALDSRQHTCYGWISQQLKLGFWVISGSQEYLGGGFTKLDLTLHAGPILLKMLQSRHYGTPAVKLRSENWNKAYGPYFIYVNEGASSADMWADAKARAKQEKASWPYDNLFSASVLRQSSERTTVKGQLRVVDPYDPMATSAFAWLGLANPGEVGSWQDEVKFYQYWVQADAEGQFAITNVRPGTYQLFGYVPFVLGGYRAPDKLVLAGDNTTLDLGVLNFSPLRDGPTLWSIGLPDRSAAEFFIPKINQGNLRWPYPANSPNRFRDYGSWSRYLDFFPTEDLVYNVSTGDWAQDWFFVQPVRPSGVNSSVPTTWRIDFPLETSQLLVPTSMYTLRIAIAGSQDAVLQVFVNNAKTGAKPLLQTRQLGRDNAMARAGIHGDYAELAVQIPSSRLISGVNSVYLRQLSVAYRFAYIMYDCIRFEAPSNLAAM